MVFFIISLFYVLICDAIARIGSDWNAGYGRSFLVSILLTPIIGAVFVLAMSTFSKNRYSVSKREKGRFYLSITRTIGIIIATNTVLFGFEIFLNIVDKTFMIDSITLYIGENFRIWQLVTHQFLHSGISHLFGNMSILVLVGSSIERKYGTTKTLIGYLLFGIVGGFFQMVAGEDGHNMAGASGAVFGMLALFALVDKSHYFRYTWFKMRYVAIFMIMIELDRLTVSNDGIGHFAHLGGMVAGLFFYLTQRKDGTEN